VPVDLGERHDAIFAAEYFMALAALQTLKKHKLHLPGHFCLVVFSNESFGEYITPSLTSVNQRNIEMAEEAAKLFLSLPTTNLYNDQKPSKIILKPELIIRESSSSKLSK